MKKFVVLNRYGRRCVPALCCLLALLAGAVTAKTVSEVRITAVSLTLDGTLRVSHSANAGSYFILLRGTQIDSIQQPVDVQLVSGATGTLFDPKPPDARAFYRVRQVALDQPLDLDGDGIDDVYELQRPSFLNPLDPRDAGLDLDNDGRSNLQEYFGKSDPTQPTGAAPLAPLLNPLPVAIRAATLVVGGSAQANLTAKVEGGSSTITGAVGADGNFQVTVPLRPDALNRLLVSVLDAQGQPSPPISAEVLSDAQPPDLFIDFPAGGAELTTDTTTVAGRVGDLLSGFMGMTVTVSNLTQNANVPQPVGGPANVAVGIGNNGTFERSGVPLVIGTNVIVAVATDALGNTITRQIIVKVSALAGARLVAVSGDAQSGTIHRRVPLPLAVKILHADGSPFTNKIVNFEVTRSDGRLLPMDSKALAADFTTRADAGFNGAGFLQLVTDTQGMATVQWTLGGDAGCANNRVSVTSRDIAGTVFFCASAQPAAPSQINIGSGNNQRGEAGSLAPEPLQVWVNDACNGAAGVPVTFTVIQGGGKVNGKDSVTVLTAQTGHASVSFTLGPSGGNNLVQANFQNNPSGPATFIVVGVKRDINLPTSFSGVVLSDSSQPVGNATCALTVGETVHTTFSDANGQFGFVQVPAGAARLLIDGTTATMVGTNAIPTNTFPALTFSALLVPNAENSLGKPVLLPRRNPNNSRVYSGITDLELTCEGAPGFKLTIKANSMRHADGTPVTPQNPAVVSLNPVHHDALPIPLPDGASPPFAWALEPGDAQFNPPVHIEYPNLSGFPPGAQINFLGFSHQTERFEIVASGRVDATGAKIVQEPAAEASATLLSAARLGIGPHGNAPSPGPSGPNLGASCPPYPADGDCSSCVVGITGPRLVQKDKFITLKAGKSPVNWDFESLGGDVTLDANGGNSVKVTGNKEGSVRITVVFNDGEKRCHGEYRIKVGQCSEDTVPLPSSFSTRAGGWSFSGTVSPANGVSITGLTLGRHYLADEMNVPYVLISLSLADGSPFQKKVKLRPDGNDSSGRSRLVGFETKADGFEGSVKAKYLIDRLPDDSSKAKLCIIQRYRFRGYDPDDHCNPFGVVCARFYPITEYEFYEDPDQPIALASVTIPQAVKFAVNNQPNIGTFTTEKIPPVVPLGGNPLQRERSFGAIASGFSSEADNFHQSYLPSITIPTPTDPTAGCHECVHIHWRWGAIAGALGTFFGGFDANWGNPIIPPDSHQSVAVGLTLFHPLTDFQPPRWQDLIDGDYLGVPQNILFWYEGTSGEPFDSFFTHGGFFLPEQPAPQSVPASTPTSRLSLASPNPPLEYTLDPDSPLVPLAPKRYGALDESWTLSAGGQTVQADPDGGFRLQNVSAPDAFGPDGTGSPPDGISDDLIRVKGISTRNGVNRYLSSEFFAVREGETFSLQNIKFSITPPLSPESMSAVVGTATLTQLGQQTQIKVTAHYSDGSAKDVTARELGTTYRTSNPNIARIDNAGNVTATGRGTAYLTAANEGATVVVQVDVLPGEPLTTLVGFVQDSSGAPVAGATVTLTGLAARAVTGPDGRFLIQDVPASTPAISLTAEFFNGVDRLQSIVSNVPLVPGGVSDMGLLTLRSAPKFALPKLATGQSHTVVIEADGSLWGWGANNDGQLGDGTTTDRLRPVRVGTDTDWVTVTATETSTASIKLDGSLWTWGHGRQGELGLGVGTTRTPSPVRVGADNDWLMVEGGDNYVLALKADGSLWAWGSNEEGRFGDGTTTGSSIPTRIGTDRDWMVVSAGLSDSGSLAVKKDGTLWAWAGSFTNKVPVQMGTENGWVAIASREGPRVSGDNLLLKADGTLWTIRFSNRQPGFAQYTADSDWKAISVSDSHGLLLKSDGSLWAYGNNRSSELGDGTLNDQTTPVRVSPQSKFAVMATRYDHNVALTSDGVYYTWGGLNENGELGLGFTQTAQPAPLHIGADNDWTAVTLGGFTAAALKSNGTLWTWGYGDFGQIGDGQLLFRAAPTRVGVDADWAIVSVGSGFVLAVKRDGTLWAWGQNFGLLGIPGFNNATVPTRVGTDHDWLTVSANGHSLALKTDGTLWAWGSNAEGELGDGTQQDRAVPTRIGADSDWQVVSAAPGSSFAIKKDGSLWAWGRNGGILGDGTMTARLAPVRIGTDNDWSVISGSGFVRLALKKDASLWGWGFDASVGLGASGRNISAPMPLPSGPSVTWLIAGAGSTHSLALSSDGSIWAAGENFYGQIGNGTSSDRDQGFSQISTDTNWKFVAGGTQVSAGIKNDGTLWTWGNYGSGVLGDPTLLMPRRIGNAKEWSVTP
jgi:alpha-tubulin suppressor-like RCC1 family protein